MKATLDPSAIIGTLGQDLYLISGRLYGADDDDAYLVRAPAPWTALDVFRDEIGVERDDAGKFILEDESGEPTHFIINVDYVGELI